MALMVGHGTSILAGVNGANSGFLSDDFAAPCGSLLPADAAINGAQIRGLYNTSSGGVGVALAGSRAQSFFTAIVINGQRLATAGATDYTNLFDYTYWTWDAVPAFTDGVLYPFSYTP